MDIFNQSNQKINGAQFNIKTQSFPVSEPEIVTVNERLSIMGYIGEELEYMIKILKEFRDKNPDQNNRHMSILFTDLEKLFAWHQTYLNDV